MKILSYNHTKIIELDTDIKSNIFNENHNPHTNLNWAHFSASWDCVGNVSIEADSIFIKGKLVDNQTGGPIYGCVVQANGFSCYSDESGAFELSIPMKDNFQIVFTYIGYRLMSVIGSPPPTQSIELDTVPMFQFPMELVNFTCRWWQLGCKYRRNRNSKGLDKSTKKRRKESNKIIDSYTYKYNGEEYHILFRRDTDILTIVL